MRFKYCNGRKYMGWGAGLDKLRLGLAACYQNSKITVLYTGWKFYSSLTYIKLGGRQCKM